MGRLIDGIASIVGSSGSTSLYYSEVVRYFWIRFQYLQYLIRFETPDRESFSDVAGEEGFNPVLTQMFNHSASRALLGL